MTTRAAIYLRISQDANSDGLAVQRQREDCLKLVASREWDLVDVYTDNSRSAFSRTAKRPEYDRLVSDFEAGRFDAIVCYDLDRLTRQPQQLEDWIARAEDSGLTLVTASGEADLSTDNGRLFARIKASVARAEVERKSARQKRAAVQRKEMGRVPLGSRLYGYAPTTGELVPDQAKVVERIFKRFAKGEALTGLAADLNASGAPTRRGGTWSPSTIRTMLLNTRYAGTFPDGSPGSWKPIVSEDLFAEVQVILSNPARKLNREGTARKHLGSGLYECGHSDDGVQMSCRNKLRTNGHRYWCHRGGHVIRTGAAIDAYVTEAVRERLSAPDVADLLTPANDDKGKALGIEIRDLRSRLRSVQNDYDEGLIDGHRLKAATSKIQLQLDATEKARAQLMGGSAIRDVLASPDPAEAFLEASLAIQRAVIDALMWVIIKPTLRGRRGFDPSSVILAWRVSFVAGDQGMTTITPEVPTAVRSLLDA